MREAPLLALALGWTRGDCRKLIGFSPYPQYKTNTECLLDLAEYLEKHESIISKELECKFFIPSHLMPPLSNEPLATIADLLHKLKFYLEMVIHSRDVGESEVQIAMNRISTYYLKLLLVLRLYCLP